jgi:predicted TIM-barrel fold metal-dependent hydrolase
MKDGLREELLHEMESIRTVDCHSHTQLRRDYYRSGEKNLFNMMAYFERDIQSVTGKSSAQLYADASSDEERWEILKGVLSRSRNVSYWRHNIVVYQGLFGLEDDELNDDNWREVNDQIKRKTSDPNWYDYVTREVCNLETQVRNIPWFEDWEPEYFTAILRMEPALELHRPSTRESLERHLNRSFTDLKSVKQGLADLVEEYRRRGAVGIKLAHAYGRTLASEDVSEERAERTFSKALSGEGLSSGEIKELQDHIIFFLAGLAGDMDLVFQIHTGVQTNWGNIPDSDPLLLIPLIRSHRNTRFDLFHAGYPYSREIGMLGKHYPNVWLNMCWMYVITMAGSRQILSEWLDLVPAERILGFGSDVGYPEFVYGHLVMARSCLADVLAEKVRRDFLSKESALDLARMMLRDNPMELYHLL